MRITKKHFHSILMELIDENPIASRGILRVAELVFTGTVPTMGITVTGRPKLCVNLEFVEEHCHSETDVKAVLIHEFLHVLLNHTEKFKHMTGALNTALDAVINSIIHRTLGAEYSGMMSRYYKDAVGPLKLLRPMIEDEAEADLAHDKLHEIWASLYQGKLVTEDLFDIAGVIGDAGVDELHPGDRTFLGSHSEAGVDPDEISHEVEAALHETMTTLDGGAIWRQPLTRGAGIVRLDQQTPAVEDPIRAWKRKAIKVLKECVTPDAMAPFDRAESAMSLPLLSEGDQRGFLRSMWSPFLPDCQWRTEKKIRRGTAQIYLDVSRSMYQEMDALLALMWRLRSHIRLPFWAFSDVVAPAEIRNGRLVTSTTGGTSINAVLSHVAETRPGKAVIITDGYIERCNPDLLAAVKGQDIRAIVSSDGSPDELERAGVPVSQLSKQ